MSIIIIVRFGRHFYKTNTLSSTRLIFLIVSLITSILGEIELINLKQVLVARVS